MDHLTRRRFVALAGGLGATTVAGCTGRADDSSESPRPTPAPTPTPPAGEEEDDHDQAAGSSTTTTVDMVTDNKGAHFDPKGLLVDPGTTVRFVNASGAHTTTAYHPSNDDKPLRIPETAEPWDSGTLTEQDAVYEVTFETEGVYDYYCIPHEMLAMVGRIIVGSPQGGPGTTEPTDLPPAAKEAIPPINAILDEGTVAGP